MAKTYRQNERNKVKESINRWTLRRFHGDTEQHATQNLSPDELRLRLYAKHGIYPGHGLDR